MPLCTPIVWQIYRVVVVVVEVWQIGWIKHTQKNNKRTMMKKYVGKCCYNNNNNNDDDMVCLTMWVSNCGGINQL